MRAQPVILIFDVGRTNKKILLFDQKYKVVFEESVHFDETLDDDGFPCEDVRSVTEWITSSFKRIVALKDFQVQAINFSGYGASFVFVDGSLAPIPPLYNYLKPYPDELLEQFYNSNGGKESFALKSASPVLASLNSGMQLYRVKCHDPAKFSRIKYALHLPQYLSSIVTNCAYSDITSIGCHTNLWDFQKGTYHEWTDRERVKSKFALLQESSFTTLIDTDQSKIHAGIGIHNSSAALIPYLKVFKEPFTLLSTGTWSISLNPFNNTPLTPEELKQDCLCYLSFEGKPVKASRYFAGHDHDLAVKQLSDYYHVRAEAFSQLSFNVEIFTKLSNEFEISSNGNFEDRLPKSDSHVDAYYLLMLKMVKAQFESTSLVVDELNCKNIFVDGGFSKNDIFMNMLTFMFPSHKVSGAIVPHASALGAALVIHHHWNTEPIPANIVQLKDYSDSVKQKAK